MEDGRRAPITTIIDEGLGNASYVVDLGDGQALVVDPGRDPGPYLRAVEAMGVALAFVAETHLHADFVSGSRELAAVGAVVLAAAEAELSFPHRGLRDDETVDLGGLVLRAIATPGHTPEHLTYELLDGSSPVALFTGGSLLRGSVARTDLITPAQTEPLARALFRSLHERLLVLPTHGAVYPTHGAGATFCSVSPTNGSDPATTIGRERRENPWLQITDEGRFVHELLDTYGSYPSYFSRLREVNRRGPRVFGTTPPPLEPLPPARVAEALAHGALVVDVRPIDRFAAGHVPGALSIALRPALATWFGWLVPSDADVIVVMDGGQDRAQLVRQCLSVGYENLVGELAEGMDAWRDAELPEERTELVEPSDVRGA